MLEITAYTAGMGDLKRLEAFGSRMPNAQANVLNRMGTRTLRAVIPTMVRQTGLSKRIITKAVKMYRASPYNPTVMLVTRGGEISYRYFGAHEVPGGVQATVMGEQVFVKGGFRRSGPKGRRRMVTKLNGQVYVNEGNRWRGHIHVEKSGVAIPAQFIRGQTAKIFSDIVAAELPIEIEADLSKLLSGAAA